MKIMCERILLSFDSTYIILFRNDDYLSINYLNSHLFSVSVNPLPASLCFLAPYGFARDFHVLDMFSLTPYRR